VTVTPVRDGFMIGRVIPEREVSGPWWTLLKIVSDRPNAITEAVALADVDQRIWYIDEPGQLSVLDPEQLWLSAARTWWVSDLEVIREKVPSLPGVYVIRSSTPLLIGHTDDLRQRLLYHHGEIRTCQAAKGAALEFCFEVILPTDEREHCAASLIAWWSPPCNETY
jgi:hypothetical protein